MMNLLLKMMNFVLKMVNPGPGDAAVRFYIHIKIKIPQSKLQDSSSFYNA